MIYQCWIHQGLPEPKGKSGRSNFFVDANLRHDKVTGRSCSGLLAMLNLTPIDWFSAAQNTLHAATHGSEFCVAMEESHWQDSSTVLQVVCSKFSFE